MPCRRPFNGAAMLSLLTAVVVCAADASVAVRAVRMGDAPIITENMLPGQSGSSINGPSLIRVPAWVKNPLGRYYLYFAHHKGKYIRMAYADRIEGPWKILEGGVQPLEEVRAVSDHIASPEAVVDEASHRIFLFYHGHNPDVRKGGDTESEDKQRSGGSVSSDGIHFTSLEKPVGPAYLRVFQYGGRCFALGHEGVLRECTRLGEPFEPIGRLFGADIKGAVDRMRDLHPAGEAEPPEANKDRVTRHIGLDVVGDRLFIYFSCIGHRPERILCTQVDLRSPPEKWAARGVREVLHPERVWEGANLPLAYSRGGISRTRVNELRDPGVFREDGQAWLVYSVAGEHGLGLARLYYGEEK